MHHDSKGTSNNLKLVVKDLFLNSSLKKTQEKQQKSEVEEKGEDEVDDGDDSDIDEHIPEQLSPSNVPERRNIANVLPYYRE